MDHAPVVAPGRPELRLGGRAQERAAESVQLLTLDHDACGRPLEGLQVGDWYAHVFEVQGVRGLEPEYIADDRSRDIGD